MRQLNIDRGLTFLIVTHDIGVGRKTDRIVRMLDGRVVEELHPEGSTMFARVTQLEIDTLRTSVDESLALFEDDVLPRLRSQPGYRGVYVMTTERGSGMLVSLWDTAEDAKADAESGFYADVLSEFVTLFKAPPGRERYEVRLTDLTSADRVELRCSACSDSRSAACRPHCVVILAAVLGVVAVLAARNLVFARLALRNVTRRRGRSALIVTGLMLATTIIAAALATGDTVSHAMRSSVLTALGSTDEMVSAKGAKPTNVVAFGQATGVGYFDDQVATRLQGRLRHQPLVDGVAPAIVEPISLQDLTSRQTEPAVTLFASNAAAAGRIRHHARSRRGRGVALQPPPA